jgi:putative membrane protein
LAGVGETRMLLTEEDKQAISEAIQRAEKRTSGEIVFAYTPASGRYRHATLQGALIGAVLATALYLALPVAHTIGLALWTEIVAFAVFFAVIPLLPQRRWLIPSREMDERVHEAAFHEFYASGLYKTRQANGVIIYLSGFEHRVVVLGDRGIHEKMGNHHWNEVRDKITAGIREGNPRAGICAAVESCGEALSRHFPYQRDDVNELPDQVIDRSGGSRPV